MTQEESFLAALQEKPEDLATIYAYCDWLTEQGRLKDAALLKKKAGLAHVFYCITAKGEPAPKATCRHFRSRNAAINSLQSSFYWDYQEGRRMSNQKRDMKLEGYEIVMMEATPTEVYRETAVPKSRREKGKKK